MKMAAFKMVCPLEIGDKVAVRITESGIKEAVYLPDKSVTVLCGEFEIHIITDIVTLHFLKDGKVSFVYELDGSKKYESLKVAKAAM